MLVFQKISIQNFGSVGNSPLEINYLKSKSTLVTANNGSGKSMLMTDALSFVLYGKPYRNINKPLLINSINQKNCVVSLELKSNKVHYTIKRGMKPNIFEIYKDGKLLDQEAASRDYQKYLETVILKMNYRTFTQVVIMGSGNYIPFMRLTPAQRREFIEDILDIRVFSIMNQLLKQKNKDIEESENKINTEIKTIKNNIALQEGFIKVLENQKEAKINDLKSRINSLIEENNQSFGELTTIQEINETLNTKYKNYDKVHNKLSDLKHLYNSINKTIKKHKETKEFFDSIQVCPTCNQPLEIEHKERILTDIFIKLETSEKATIELENKINEVQTSLLELDDISSVITDNQIKIGNIQSHINSSNKIIEQYQKEMSSSFTENNDIENERRKIKTLAKNLINLDKDKKEILELKEIGLISQSLLKDSGIKAKIIRQYIPIFNKMINFYLQKMELFVSFNLDENFNETVLSRHRDNFTYESFSAGEKQRIDLAMMFVFREIARLKNAVAVNVLIMDETLDTSLDSTGVDNFFSIVETLDKTNLFVISHRENMADKFESTIKLNKVNNYTIMSV